MSSIAKPQRRSLGSLIGGAAYGRAFRRIEPAIDADAAKYLAAVEAADKQVLEDGVKRAVSAFVRACKADGNWDAIKASCILCGARTLAGALVPLKGAAPTSNNFVGLGTDYSRTSGLTGNGSTKYLDSNFTFSAAQQDDAHLSVWITENATSSSNIIGCQTGVETRILTGGSTSGNQNGRRSGLNQGSLDVVATSGTWTGLNAVSRSSSSSYTFLGNASTYNIVTSSSAAPSERMFVFTVSNSDVPDSNYFNGTIAFYSIGEAVDLALLDTAVSTLVSEIGAAV